MDKTITRSTVNNQDYAAPEFPKSGFNLGYRDYNDYMLGRWHVSGYQWCMPSDKISGNNKGNFTYNRIVTSMMAPTHVGQYNVYVTLRSIDNTFQENVAPSKYNGFSAEWRMPTINTKELIKMLMKSYGFEDPSAIFAIQESEQDADDGGDYTLLDILKDMLYYESVQGATYTLGDYFSNSGTLLHGDVTLANFLQKIGSVMIQSLTSAMNFADVDNQPIPSLYSQAEDMYCVDALKDVEDFIYSRLGKFDENYQATGVLSSTTISEFVYNLLDCLLTPFVGRYSYFADFGYNFVRPSDIYRISHVQKYQITSLESFYDFFDSTPMNEYALRAMYAFWYDRCRDVNLQPVSSTLPKPRQFGSTSVLNVYEGGNLMYLLYRIRRWTEDMFVSAQPDSPARHVYAPIYSRSADVTQNSENDYATSQQEKITSTEISFLDSLTGETVSVGCPVPSVVNDALSHVSLSSVTLSQVLPLQSLRQAQSIERYLKRLDYFGDEYNDYMLSQYNSRVSDLRINHPEILSQSFDDANYDQQVSNVSTSAGTQVGDRTATGTLKSGGDGFSTFCEEFGIIINVISFMPDAAYDGANPQLLMDRLVDLPLPIFAANNDELGRVMEISANSLSSTLAANADFTKMFGHYPAYHAWRSRVDRVRGSFLNEHQDCLFRRFYGMTDASTMPKLNYPFVNCRPNLQMFANTVRYDGQLYGDVVHECYVERVLPTPVETI